MDSVEIALLDAWKKVYPKLLADPAELQKRLARRRLALLTRPPRAWCLAIRASDTRITPASAIITPEDAAYPGRPDLYRQHEVVLDHQLLQKLCQPVRITPPGESWKDVARKLGVDPRTLNSGRISGLFQHVYWPPDATHRGKPCPILYTSQLLDPSARRFAMPDPLWTWTATFLTNRLDPTFQQTVKRIPIYAPITGKHRYRENVHPELIDAPPPPTYSRRVPPPPLDYVWYKWKDGVYVGDPIENRRREINDRRNATLREHRRLNPPPKPARGSLIFRRFVWLCPQCHRTAGTLYLPLPPKPLIPGQIRNPKHEIRNKLQFHNLKFETSDLTSASSVESFRISDFDIRASAQRQFACRRCHRVYAFTSSVKGAWNELITYLSGGLLYGSEVPRPDDFQPQRIHKPHRPCATRAPSKRREQITPMLLKLMSPREIADELGISFGTASTHIHRIYQQHGVSGRAALARKLGVVLPDPNKPRRDEVLKLTLDGLSRPNIAKVMRISPNQVHHLHRCLYREYGVQSIKQLKEKLGKEQDADLKVDVTEGSPTFSRGARAA